MANSNPVLAAPVHNITIYSGEPKQLTIVASDPDGDRLSYTPSNPAHGTLMASTIAGKFIYTSTPGFQGSDTFTVNVSDGKGGTALQTVQLLVLPSQNPPPVGGGGGKNSSPVLAAPTHNVTATEDTAKLITFVATDPDGDKLTFTPTKPAHGTIVNNAVTPSKFIYTPDANFSGTDTFTVTISDGRGGTVTQNVQVLVTGVNDAPTVEAAQAIKAINTASTAITVKAVDPDGDAVTWRAANAAHGKVIGGADGVFAYTPDAGYKGTDSFRVTVTDGKGGTSTQTINITVSAPAANTAPTVAASQSITTDAEEAKQITVKASDADGDTLNYVAGVAAKGTVTGGAAGVFTYTPKAGVSGADSFLVTVSDGKGGTATHTVNLTIAPIVTEPAPSNQFKLFAADGYSGEIGGGGEVLGTSGFQEIEVLDQAGNITFDGTFNKGGDIIRLPGVASSFTVALQGSSVVLKDVDNAITIPVGSAGTRIVFDDGVRTLVYADGQVKFGSQTVTSTATALTAPTDNSALPGGRDDDATARTFLSEGAKATFGGDQQVFGTKSAEELHYTRGDLTLDATFNLGGDKLYLGDAPEGYTAYVSGSAVVLHSGLGNVTIPVGVTGMILNIDGQDQLLRFDVANSKVMIGDLAITAHTLAEAVPIGSGDRISLDVGGGASTVPIRLDADTAYTLTDQASATTNVRITGFGADDIIKLLGVSDPDAYSFTTGTGANATDLHISNQGPGGVANIIVIEDSLINSGFVVNYDTAVAAVGHDFMTIG